MRSVYSQQTPCITLQGSWPCLGTLWGSSLFWEIPAIVELLQAVPGYDAIFHNCVHGGRRNKSTRWWSTHDIFQPLAAKCPGTHPHASWAPRIMNGRPVYPTKEEAEYPKEFCTRVAALLRDSLMPIPQQQALYGPASATLRCVLEQQPRKVQSLVPEYAHYDPWALPLDSTAALRRLLQCYPKGSRAVRKQMVQWGKIRACVIPSQSSEILSKNLTSSWSWATKNEEDGS